MLLPVLGAPRSSISERISPRSQRPLLGLVRAMTVSLHRTLVVLKRPTQVPVLLRFTQLIISKMKGNPRFPSPSPSLAKVAAAMAALEEAEVATQSKTRGLVAARNAKHATLVSLLERLKGYVQSVADDDPDNAVSIIESSGMSVKAPTAAAKPPLVAKPGKVKGAVRLAARAVAKEASYEWAWSSDRGETWHEEPKTLQAKTAITGLPSEVTCLFRFRARTRRKLTDWSGAVACLVP
jgi:hypothetical protein